MAEPAEILKEVHRLMRHVADLDAKIKAGPRALKSAQAALARHEEAVKKNHDEVNQYKIKIHEKEVSIKQMQQHIEKLEKAPVSNKKEYDAMLVEVATVKKAIRGLEDEILEYMGWIEEKQGKVPELEKAVQQAKNDLARVEKENLQMQGRYVEEQQKARDQLAEVQKTIPATIEPLYQRLVTARGAEALAGVQDRTCTACYTEITHQMRNELVQGKFVICKNCNRMLYIA